MENQKKQDQHNVFIYCDRKSDATDVVEKMHELAMVKGDGIMRFIFLTGVDPKSSIVIPAKQKTRDQLKKKLIESGYVEKCQHENASSFTKLGHWDILIQLVPQDAWTVTAQTLVAVKFLKHHRRSGTLATLAGVAEVRLVESAWRSFSRISIEHHSAGGNPAEHEMIEERIALVWLSTRIALSKIPQVAKRSITIFRKPKAAHA